MKLSLNRDLTLDQIQNKVNNGAKFIAYSYIISVPIFMPVRRISKLYFIESGYPLSVNAMRYNIANFMLGIWGLPMGPPIMIKTIISNMRGGIDLTDDVMANITEEAVNTGIINMEKPASAFILPNKSNKSEFKKVYKRLIANNTIKEPMHVGLYIDTIDNEKPYHVIYIDQNLSDNQLQEVRNAIYKRFFKHNRFDILSLNSEIPENYQTITDVKYRLEL
jgi:hypothetical protein